MTFRIGLLLRTITRSLTRSHVNFRCITVIQLAITNLRRTWIYRRIIVVTIRRICKSATATIRTRRTVTVTIFIHAFRIFCRLIKHTKIRLHFTYKSRLNTVLVLRAVIRSFKLIIIIDQATSQESCDKKYEKCQTADRKSAFHHALPSKQALRLLKFCSRRQHKPDSDAS